MVLSNCCDGRGRLFPFIKRIFADGGYAGEKMALTSGAPEYGNWKSSSDPTLLASRSCPSDGLSKGPSPGSVATAVWLATSNVTP